MVCKELQEKGGDQINTAQQFKIKQKYEAELKRKLKAEELEKDVEDNNKIVHQRVDTVARCIQRLDEIALRPNPFSTPQYISPG